MLLRKTFPLLLLCMHLINAGYGQNFDIKGTIRGRDNGLIFLSYLKSGASVRDTAIINGGSFYFKGTIDRPVQGLFDLEGLSVSGWIYLDTGHITVSAQADTFRRDNKLINSLTLRSVKGSVSDSLQKNIYGYWQVLKSEELNSEERAEKMYRKIYEFVKAYPDHNLGSELLSVADMLSYKQARNIFTLMSERQQDMAAETGVKTLLQQLERTSPGSTYQYIPQPDTSGRMITGRENHSKYLLIEFWASWCGPCREENPHLKELYNQYKDQGFDILGVSLDENKASWTNAIRKDGLPWLQVSDLKGINNEIAQYYMVRSIPFNLLLDEQGKIIAKSVRGALLDQELATLMNVADRKK